jgi:hypothetical protein
MTDGEKTYELRRQVIMLLFIERDQIEEDRSHSQTAEPSALFLEGTSFPGLRLRNFLPAAFVNRLNQMRFSLYHKATRHSSASPSEIRPGFLRRVKECGAIESACPACFEVVSTQQSATDVASDEANHRCGELILKETLDYFRSHLIVERPASHPNE